MRKELLNNGLDTLPVDLRTDRIINKHSTNGEIAAITMAEIRSSARIRMLTSGSSTLSKIMS